MTPLVLVGLVLCRSNAERDDDGASILALGLLPLTILPWAFAKYGMPGYEPMYLAAVVVTVGVVVSWWFAQRWQPKSQELIDVVLPTHFWILAGGLIWVCLAHIERNALAIAFELLGVAYLILFTSGKDIAGERRSTRFGTAAVIAVALVLQAMMLRLLGPDRVMNVRDLFDMKLPAVVSLMWATLGGGLAWWGTKRGSRPVWAAGATLLVAAATKLVLFDFGSLGDLRNILALIAAGLVFLGVAWLAPVPPKRDPPIEDKPSWSPPSGGFGGPQPGPPRRAGPPPIPGATEVSAAAMPVAAVAAAVPTAVARPLNRAVFPAPPPLEEAETSSRTSAEN
jgi:hypothetical protein